MLLRATIRMQPLTVALSCTVPLLWDKKHNTIVNNESSDIIRMFNTAFNNLLPKDRAELDLYPQAHRAEIDELNEWVYHTINSPCISPASITTLLTIFPDGVYKAGFAKTQQAYEAAVIPLFESLDRLENVLTGKDYLVGDRLTEADVRLFVTIVNVLPLYPLFTTHMAISGSLRSCILPQLQVQPPFDPGRLPCDPSLVAEAVLERVFIQGYLPLRSYQAQLLPLSILRTLTLRFFFGRS